MEASEELRRLVNGYQITQALHVAAVLDLSELMAGDPRAVADLAEQTGTHEQSLFRLLRALASLGIYERHEDGRFSNTDVGEALRTGTPGSATGWARFVGTPQHWQAWGALEHSVRTGENAFESIHGMSVWEFRERDPDERAVFDAAMTGQTVRLAAAVVAAYDFGRHETLVDVGGGRGALLATILARNPSLQGILFDQPSVIADAAPTLHDAGVSDRCQLVGGNFFDAVPSNADAYVLKWVIHDWHDDEAVAILRACRQAIAPDGRHGVLRPEHARLPGGHERTLAEYRSLLGAAGFALGEVVPASDEMFVLRAAPA